MRAIITITGGAFDGSNHLDFINLRPFEKEAASYGLLAGAGLGYKLGTMPRWLMTLIKEVEYVDDLEQIINGLRQAKGWGHAILKGSETWMAEVRCGNLPLADGN